MLRIHKNVFLLAALLLLTLPLNWLLSAVFAAVFHELCHIFMIRMVNGRIRKVCVGLCGAEIEIASLLPWQELLCALAGPVGSLLLMCCFRWFPRIAVCAGVQAVYNLLPIYPLDGGRALRCGLCLLSPKLEKAAGYVEKAALLTVGAAALAAAFLLRLGLFPLILAGMLIIKKNSLQSGASRGTIVLHRMKTDTH